MIITPYRLVPYNINTVRTNIKPVTFGANDEVKDTGKKIKAPNKKMLLATQKYLSSVSNDIKAHLTEKFKPFSDKNSDISLVMTFNVKNPEKDNFVLKINDNKNSKTYIVENDKITQNTSAAQAKAAPKNSKAEKNANVAQLEALTKTKTAPENPKAEKNASAAQSEVLPNISAAKKNITIEPSIAQTKNSSLDDTLKFLLTENNIDSDICKAIQAQAIEELKNYDNMTLKDRAQNISAYLLSIKKDKANAIENLKPQITSYASIIYTEEYYVSDLLNNEFKVRDTTIESRNYISPTHGYYTELHAEKDDTGAHITINKWGSGDIEEHYYLQDGKLDYVYICKEDKKYCYEASELEKDNPKPIIKDRY